MRRVDERIDMQSLQTESQLNNFKRAATRYVRSDIKTVFYKSNLLTDLRINRFRTLIDAQLLDISSKGAMIATTKELNRNDKIVLGLKFPSKKTFRINASVIREETSPQLAELETTEKVIFNFWLFRKYRFKFSVLKKTFDPQYHYGLKFDYNDELGNYLLESQSELKFK